MVAGPAVMVAAMSAMVAAMAEVAVAMVVVVETALVVQLAAASMVLGHLEANEGGAVVEETVVECRAEALLGGQMEEVVVVMMVACEEMVMKGRVMGVAVLVAIEALAESCTYGAH